MPGVGKVPRSRAAGPQAALKIIDGVASSQIPIAHDRAGKLNFSTRIAAQHSVENSLGWNPGS